MSEEILDLYQKDIDMKKLNLHLQILPDWMEFQLDKLHRFKQNVMFLTSSRAFITKVHKLLNQF